MTNKDSRKPTPLPGVGCRLCKAPIPMGSLVLCEIKTCKRAPTGWFHEPKTGLHWLTCDKHAEGGAS